jgi:hypothetical protein
VARERSADPRASTAISASCRMAVNAAGIAAHIRLGQVRIECRDCGITGLGRNFRSRTTQTTDPAELRPARTADAGVMDQFSFSRVLLYAVHNHISTLGHERFRRKLAVFRPVKLSIERGCVYLH